MFEEDMSNIVKSLGGGLEGVSLSYTFLLFFCTSDIFYSL